MPILANTSFSTIRNKGLAIPYILANAYSGELLRARLSGIEWDRIAYDENNASNDIDYRQLYTVRITDTTERTETSETTVK